MTSLLTVAKVMGLVVVLLTGGIAAISAVMRRMPLEQRLTDGQHLAYLALLMAYVGVAAATIGGFLAVFHCLGELVTP